MQFMLILATNEKDFTALPPAEVEEMFQKHMDFGRDTRAAGAFVAGNRLRPSPEAQTLRLRNGKQVVVDGPFAETKEVVGGYYIIEAKSVEEAVEWAKKLPLSSAGAIEVRPIWQM